jgi:hypothetical protein
MKKNLMMIGVLVIVGIASLLESPYFIDQHKGEFYSIPASANVEEEEEADYVMSLEKELVGKDIIDGYVVEEYQEFEVYRDQEGQIVKSVPTSNFDYLRYFIEKPE